MTSKNFEYHFTSSKDKKELFEYLKDPTNWWMGKFEETIDGKSERVNDEFNFLAGGGMHNSTQRLVELIPNKKIVWLVTQATLTFVNKTDEWVGTQFYFELSDNGPQTEVTFVHQGLNPSFECYDGCSSGWTQYLNQLEERLK